ncbi:MAG TPA: sulfite exporter TauE/SafE family protein, partial [Gaiellaceae bacterium]
MHAVVLVLVAAWCFTTALAGGLAGLVLGNIRLPALLLVASTPAAGAGANIGVSAVAAASAGAAHVRAGRVDWRLVAWMLPPSVAGAVAGGLVSGALPSHVLLAVIGGALLVFGIDLLRPKRAAAARVRSEPDVRAAVVAGALIGFLGGLVGLILGTLRLPALLRYVGEAPARAIGTNLVVGVAVGVAGVVGHLPGGVDW